MRHPILACLLALAAAAPGAAPQVARADALLNGSHRTEMLDCLGADALVNGDGNQLKFHGNCRSLRVNGGGNAVEVELAPGGRLDVSGDGNRIEYTTTGPEPSVSAQGSGNRIAAAGAGFGVAMPDAAPAPAALEPAPVATVVLDGDDQDRDIDCAARNVLIHGSGGRFTLRGGCRAVSVQGRANRIRAELVPGARVSIGGDAVTLDYTLTSDGPPPVVAVTGANSQATHTTRTAAPVAVAPQ